MDIQLLELIFLSEKRKELLLFLRGGPKTIAEIKMHLDVGAVAILPQLKKLRENSLIIKKGNIYRLSSLGIAIAGTMQSMVDLLSVFEKRYDYWASHSVDCIPIPLRRRIGELSNCTFSESHDGIRLFEPHREFLENIRKSKKVSGISSIFHPLYPSLFLNFAKTGIDVSILVTLPVYQRIKEEFTAELSGFITLENASFYVCSKKIEFSYVVTDKFVSLSLPFPDGRFDYKEDVMCFDSVAIQWGEDLFAHYRDVSEKITEI
jgi:predicted transcriptional regulator